REREPGGEVHKTFGVGILHLGQVHDYRDAVPIVFADRTGFGVTGRVQRRDPAERITRRLFARLALRHRCTLLFRHRMQPGDRLGTTIHGECTIHRGLPPGCRTAAGTHPLSWRGLGGLELLHHPIPTPATCRRRVVVLPVTTVIRGLGVTVTIAVAVVVVVVVSVFLSRHHPEVGFHLL